MIDREKLMKCVDAMEAVELLGLGAFISIYQQAGSVELTVYPTTSGFPPSDDCKHKVLAILTPIVGRMDKLAIWENNLGYRGEKDRVKVTFSQAEACKIMGYKTVKTVRPKMVEVPGEIEEEETTVTITDCDLKSGRFTEKDIEVAA